MIEYPDGTKRFPTKEEVIERVRRLRVQGIEQTVDRAASTSIDNSGSGQNDASGYEEHDGHQRAAPPTDIRDTPIVQNRTRRDNRFNGPNYRAKGQPGTDSSSTHQYNWRSTTDSTENDDTATTDAVWEQQQQASSNFRPSTGGVKGFISPYVQAISQSIHKREEQKKKKPQTGKTRKVLSEVEAREKRDDLIATLLMQTDNMDSVIRATTKGHMPVIIWSTIDKEEATILADFMLDEGKKSVRWADSVRNLIELRRRVQVGAITLPRAYQSFMTYIERGFGLR